MTKWPSIITMPPMTAASRMPSQRSAIQPPIIGVTYTRPA